MKSNNKGFSLIELIICITILALFSTLVVVGLGYMDLANSKKCVSKIDSGLMTLKSRNMADSKRTYLHIQRQITTQMHRILRRMVPENRLQTEN